MEDSVAKLQESARSFDVRNIPNYADLKSMRRETKVVKRLWDLINSFQSYVASWKIIPWKRVDFEEIEDVSLININILQISLRKF